MQTIRIVQAVAIMMIVALAASCAASKEYTSKIFAPRDEQVKDSQAVALKFLDMDSLKQDGDGWVSTDIIMGRDTVNSTAALDNLAEIYPAKQEPVVTKQDKAAEKTNKQVTGTNPVKEETKNMSAADKTGKPAEPLVVKNTPYGSTRNKKSRTEKP